ncbi:hypothetical protein YPPY07_4760, partial [Yersinia pestis PY-07]|jgi:tRNA pseudouridine38-40 synthase
MAGAG